jgi:plastocyanin
MRFWFAVLAGGLVGCFSDRPATGPEPPVTGVSDVAIHNFAFAPANLSVTSGTTVTWTNDDDVNHTVTSDDGAAFDSGAFAQGKTFQFTAGMPGTYTYSCKIHTFMKATLTVTSP